MSIEIDESKITFQPVGSDSRTERVNFYYDLELIGTENTWYKAPDGTATWFGNWFAEHCSCYVIHAGLVDKRTAQLYLGRAGVKGKIIAESYGDRFGVKFDDVLDAVKFYLVNRETLRCTPDREAQWTEEHKAFLSSDEEPACVAAHRRRINDRSKIGLMAMVPQVLEERNYE